MGNVDSLVSYEMLEVEIGCQEGKQGYKASPCEIRSAVVNEFHGVKVIDGEIAEDLFVRGLCLPSWTAMTDGDLDRVVETILNSRPG